MIVDDESTSKDYQETDANKKHRIVNQEPQQQVMFKRHMRNLSQSSLTLPQQQVVITSDYLIKQRERHEKENEVQLLLNRIAMLQQETEKICKRTALAKQKTTDIVVNKALLDER